jgi:hypothetical protein
MPLERWIQSYEGDTGGFRVTASAQVELDRAVDIGREGAIALGVRVPNRGVSRVAARITPVDRGWLIEVRNRNGAVLHPWGQPSQLATADAVVNWPLVGVRMLHDTTSTQHWALLAAADLAVTPAGPGAANDTATSTEAAGRPGELPPAEREAVLVTFAELLAWPPVHPATPLQLKQAASRIGISVSGVQERLNAAKRRAARLGNNRDIGLTDPSYLYTLVRGGYLPLPRVPEPSTP